MHFHWQNLNEKPGDKNMRASGSPLVHGRAWLGFGKRHQLYWSWNLWTRFCALGLSCNDEDGIQLHVALPPVSFWVSLRLSFLQKFYNRFDAYDLSVRIFDWSVWFNLWCDDNCWTPGESFWHKHRRRFTIHPIDLLFGRLRHENRVLAKHPIEVAMPEGVYLGEANEELAIWKRPRWPFWPMTHRCVRFDIKMSKPIPFPGKGENSWDCGEDAVYGGTYTARNVPEAIAAITKSVLRDRYKYGGRTWRPEQRAS